MREFLEVGFLSFLHACSLTLAGIGGAITAASEIVHVYFLRRASRHDEVYAPKNDAVVATNTRSTKDAN